ncbi:MAG: queuosine salvage family protein [Micavibrio sp.]
MKHNIIRPQPVPADIFDQIREGFRIVVARSSHVRICEEKLVEYALSLQPRPPANTLDAHHHYITEDPESLAAYIMILESVNFGSGFEESLVAEGWPRIDNSLYYTVSTALKASFETFGPWNTEILRRLSVADIHGIFMLPEARMGQALASLFTASLNELGAFIDEEFNGRFMGLIEESGGLASRLVTCLGQLPGFQDVHDYQGRDIPIYKRAQISAADLHLAFSRIGRPLFGDIDRLTIFADSGLPLVLRMDGILEVTPDLSRRIEAGEFIPSGSEEEIELRCCAAEAVERLAAIKGMRVVDLDHLLWHRSVEDPKYKSSAAHRTLSRFY